jgi:hypothetical protein
MSGPVIAFLTVQAVVFAIWTFLVFRALFGILRRHNAATGRLFIGPGDVISVYGAYLKDPSYSQEKRRILMLTGLLLILTILFAATF